MEADNEAIKDLVQIVHEKFALVDKGDYFALLGVESSAESTEIRDAYFRLAKIFHPDSIRRLDVDGVEEEALAVFKALSEAYGVLSDKRSRIMYEQEGAQAVSPASRAEKRDKIAEARIFFHKGSMFLQRRAYAEAAKSFFKAVELDPGSSRYKSHLGYALMMNPDLPRDRRLDEARGWFEKAVEASENDHEPYYFMSLYYKAVGNLSKQRAFLQDALTINPNHVDSKREARLLSMRSRRNATSGVHDMVRQVRAALAKLTKKK